MISTGTQSGVVISAVPRGLRREVHYLPAMANGREEEGR